MSVKIRKMICTELFKEKAESAPKEKQTDLESLNNNKKYDLVIAVPDSDELDDWREDAEYADVLVNNASGWCCYIAANSEYFNKNSNFEKCFDCPEFPFSFKQYENASNAVVNYFYNWMATHECCYEKEGFMGFYSVSTKAAAIALLKSCPLIGRILEIDSNDNIIKIY